MLCYYHAQETDSLGPFKLLFSTASKMEKIDLLVHETELGNLDSVQYMLDNGMKPSSREESMGDTVSLIRTALVNNRLGMATFLWNETDATFVIDDEFYLIDSPDCRQWSLEKHELIRRFLDAVEAGDLTKMKTYLKEDPRVRKGMKSRMGAVLIAIIHGHRDIVTYLVTNGFLLPTQTIYDLFIIAQDFEKFESVWHLAYDIEEGSVRGMLLELLFGMEYMLKYPCRNLDFFLKIVKILVIHRNGFLPREDDNAGGDYENFMKSLLPFVDLETFQHMIDGRSLDGGQGDILLRYVIQKTDNVAMVEWLVNEKKVEVTTRALKESLRTVGGHRIANWFLDNRLVHVEKVIHDKSGNTLLLTAAKRQQVILVTNLIKVANADIDKKNKKGETVWTTLEWTNIAKDFSQKHERLIKVLLERSSPPPDVLRILESLPFTDENLVENSIATKKLLDIKVKALEDVKREVLVQHRVPEALEDLIGTYLPPVRLTDN